MKKIVVLGGGESGFGSAFLAKKNGYDVFLSDKGKLKELYRDKLIDADIPFEEGQHTMDIVLLADEIIKSPGLPEKSEVMLAVRERGISVVSEIEFAGRYTDAKCICITGSNGKTTITSVLYEMLRAGGLNVGLGGNIGKSFAYQVATESYDWYVLELSSFQLDDMHNFRAHISLLTNITPDHLDRYDYKFENYIASKFRVVQNQNRDNYFVYNVDDIETMRYLKNNKMTDVNMYGVSAKVDTKCTLEGEVCQVELNDENITFDLSKRICKGLHNAYNLAQASVAALLVGVMRDVVQRVINTFSGVEHRMEHVGRYGGVCYINDSKATNVDAAWYALDSVKESMVWIAGGTDKGNDYSQLYSVVSNVHTLVCMGVDNSKLLVAFEGRIPNIISENSFKNAMESVVKSAKEEDVVLLSPACASFDLFKNYEHRGEAFKDYVNMLNK